jgi:hypothetical protein
VRHAGKALIIDPDSEFSNLLREQLAVLRFEPCMLEPAAEPTCATLGAMMSGINWLFIDVQMLQSQWTQFFNRPRLHVVVMGWDDEIHDVLQSFAPIVLYLNKAQCKTLQALAQALGVDTRDV